MNMKSLKNDFKLLAIILGAGLILLLLTRILPQKKGTAAIVSVDGKVYCTLPLSNDTSLTVSTDYGTNVVTVKGGKVFVESADCPDKICVGHRAVNSGNESIVCLPHRLVIEITDSNPEDVNFDAVSE